MAPEHHPAPGRRSSGRTVDEPNKLWLIKNINFPFAFGLALRFLSPAEQRLHGTTYKLDTVYLDVWK